MRLIDADELMKHKGNCYDEEGHLLYAVGTGNIMRMPTIEERKKGKWKIEEMNTFEMSYGTVGYEPVYRCSVCERVTESYFRYEKPIMPEDADFPRFCPNCGADMRGDTDE